MAVIKAGPAVPSWIAAGIIGIILGGVGGFYGSRWNDPDRPAGASKGGGMGGGGMGGGGMMGGGGGGMMGGMGGGGGMGGMGGGMMGGGGGGGGAAAHPQAAGLVRTISSLAVLEKARGHELTADQRARLAKAAEPLAAGAKMSEAQAEASLKDIQSILTAAQATAVEELLPRPGGGGGGGGRGGPGGGPPGARPAMAGAGGPPGGSAAAPPATAASAAGNRPASNGPGGGGMGGGMMGGGGGGFGGGGIDYEQPFKEGRGKDRLEELLASLKK